MKNLVMCLVSFILRPVCRADREDNQDLTTGNSRDAFSCCVITSPTGMAKRTKDEADQSHNSILFVLVLSGRQRQNFNNQVAEVPR